MIRFRVVAVLGKRPKNRITGEFASRIEFLVSELQKDRVVADLIGFSGANNEAEAGQEYFTQLLKKSSLRMPELFLDTEARNSIENAQNILTKIQQKTQCPGKDVSLTLVSSDYHIDRIEIVDQRTQNQSFLKPVKRLVGELNLLRAPYPYRDNWKGQLYLCADRLTIMRVNIEGILQGNEGKIITSNIEDFRDTLLRLTELLNDRDTSNPGDQTIKVKVDRALGQLMPCYFQLARLSVIPRLSINDRRFIDLVYPILDDAIRKLNITVDPDQPI